MKTNLSFENSFSYKYTQLKLLVKISVASSLLGFHCRVKYTKHGPYFQAFLTSKNTFFSSSISFIHYIFILDGSLVLILFVSHS